MSELHAYTTKQLSNAETTERLELSEHSTKNIPRGPLAANVLFINVLHMGDRSLLLIGM